MSMINTAIPTTLAGNRHRQWMHGSVFYSTGHPHEVVKYKPPFPLVLMVGKNMKFFIVDEDKSISIPGVFPVERKC
jgi:hypothetical protein